MINFQKPDNEEPNSNQSSFGPSNQSSSFAGESQPDSGSSSNSGWAAPSQPQQQQSQIQPLPWQQNDMQQQSSISAPQNNPYVQQQQQQPQWQTQDVGHEGTTQGGMNRQQFRDAWMQSGVSNNQGMDQWLAQNGGQRLNDSGVVRTPFGEILDMGMAFKTGSGKPAWTDVGMNQMPQGQFGGFGPSQQQTPQFQGGMFGGNPQQQMQQQQMNPQMMQMLQQSMMGMQNQQMPQQMNNQAGKPNLFQNSGQQMDISSLLAAPSAQLGQQGGGINPGALIPQAQQPRQVLGRTL